VDASLVGRVVTQHIENQRHFEHFLLGPWSRHRLATAKYSALVRDVLDQRAWRPEPPSL